MLRSTEMPCKWGLVHNTFWRNWQTLVSRQSICSSKTWMKSCQFCYSKGNIIFVWLISSLLPNFVRWHGATSTIFIREAREALVFWCIVFNLWLRPRYNAIFRSGAPNTLYKLCADWLVFGVCRHVPLSNADVLWSTGEWHAHIWEIVPRRAREIGTRLAASSDRKINGF